MDQTLLCAETAVEIYRREREERRQRLKRQRPSEPEKPVIIEKSVIIEKPINIVPPQAKHHKPDGKMQLPPGWLDCPTAGNEIGCIVPSKVPLGENFNDCILPGKRYSYKQVIRQQGVLGRKVGMVIDLTNTNRYYSVSDWRNEGVKYVKISCKGRDSVPDNSAVNRFVYEVAQFRERDWNKYVLVHCTHGHNRTGFMIVHYLMRVMSMSVTQAINIFADARPPGIYKQDYLDALYVFYHERKPDGILCPITPDWKRSSGFDEEDDGAPTSSGSEICEMEGLMTNDDILGDSIPSAQQEVMRQFCYQALKLGPAGVKGHSHFPGSHPVSLNSVNLELLKQHKYFATWKADGTRYMMLITMDGCYLIDRKFNFRRVQMRFPCRATSEGAEDRTHHFTLLDGEMIIDTLPDSNKKERRYLIYDMMAINQVSITDRPFCERWKMIEKEVIEPRNQERYNIFQSKNPYYRYDLEPFRARRKDFWFLSCVPKVLKEFIPKLPHDADGLIFQRWDDQYVPRTCEQLLKWKYATMNSVDFLFEMVESSQLLYLYERGKKKLMKGNKIIFKDETDPSLYSGKIVECSLDIEKEVWVFMRMRPDKSTPNEFNTYQKVLRSIKDNITEEVLLNQIDEIIRLPMYATGR
ncbi:mRNA guanylyltransferase [Heracleum sosnowskyi]|uniref:mRNA guanylyltransferase n=1 Tax=Heracleum sosnowskyi TaxID=360622 RepID=A0AAD8MTY7_9APIA|nr:mRNA guanylyltransferase [Heracleum sosnowskyi]